MIRLTKEDGAPILVNPDYLVSVFPRKSADQTGAVLNFKDHRYHVLERFDEIEAMLAALPFGDVGIPRSEPAY
jgi:hypothetical protein